MGPELSTATLRPPDYVPRLTINQAFEKARRDNLEYVEKYKLDYAIRLGARISFVRANLASHDCLRGSVVACPHIPVGEDAVAYSTVWGDGLELRLCGMCDEAFRAYEATQLD